MVIPYTNNKKTSTPEKTYSKNVCDLDKQSASNISKASVKYGNSTYRSNKTSESNKLESALAKNFEIIF